MGIATERWTAARISRTATGIHGSPHSPVSASPSCGNSISAENRMKNERRETSFSVNRTEQYALYMSSAASPVTAAKSVTANIERRRGGSV